MLPGQLQSASAAWGHRLIDQQTTDGRLIEPEVLTVVVHAHHVALVVTLDEPIEDPIKDVSVEDGNGEDVADEVQRVNGDPEGEDTDPAGRGRLVEGSEWLLVGVVDGVTVASCSGLPRNSSLYSRIMLHHRSKSGQSSVDRMQAGWNTPVGMTLSSPPAMATRSGFLRRSTKVAPAGLRRMVRVLIDSSSG